MDHRLSLLALAVAALFTSAGCEAKASREECKQMVDRMTELQLEGLDPTVKEMTLKMMEKEHATEEAVVACTGNILRSRTRCVVDAKSKADMEKCN